MAFKLSNNLIGLLNFLTFLLSIPILAGGIWLSSHGGEATDCDRYLQTPLIILGAFLMLVSIAGLIGSCCGVAWLLWIYAAVMFVLIVVVLGFTIFAFVVTNKGAGEAVSGRGYKEYRLGDYSTWLQRRVDKHWDRIKTCLIDAKVCRSMQERNQSFNDFVKDSLSPTQSGCCKPPTECGFSYQNATFWTKTPNISSNNPDCDAWQNDQNILCYNCQSCKAGFIANLKHDWKKVAVLNIIFLVILIIIYSISCCAFRNVRRDDAYAGWKPYP